MGKTCRHPIGPRLNRRADDPDQRDACGDLRRPVPVIGAKGWALRHRHTFGGDRHHIGDLPRRVAQPNAQGTRVVIVHAVLRQIGQREH